MPDRFNTGVLTQFNHTLTPAIKNRQYTESCFAIILQTNNQRLQCCLLQRRQTQYNKLIV